MEVTSLVSLDGYRVPVGLPHFFTRVAAFQVLRFCPVTAVGGEGQEQGEDGEGEIGRDSPRANCNRSEALKSSNLSQRAGSRPSRISFSACSAPSVWDMEKKEGGR